MGVLWECNWGQVLRSVLLRSFRCPSRMSGPDWGSEGCRA